jgi:hypothetical protein
MSPQKKDERLAVCNIVPPPLNRIWAFTLLWRRNVPTEMYYLLHIHNLTFSLEVVSVCKFLLEKGLGNCIRGENSPQSLDDLVIVLSRVGWPSFPFNSRKRKREKCVYIRTRRSLSLFIVSSSSSSSFA